MSDLERQEQDAWEWMMLLRDAVHKAPRNDEAAVDLIVAAHEQALKRWLALYEQLKG